MVARQTDHRCDHQVRRGRRAVPSLAGPRDDRIVQLCWPTRRRSGAEARPSRASPAPGPRRTGSSSPSGVSWTRRGAGVELRCPTTHGRAPSCLGGPRPPPACRRGLIPGAGWGLGRAARTVHLAARKRRRQGRRPLFVHDDDGLTVTLCRFHRRAPESVLSGGRGGRRACWTEPWGSPSAPGPGRRAGTLTRRSGRAAVLGRHRLVLSRRPSAPRPLGPRQEEASTGPHPGLRD